MSMYEPVLPNGSLAQHPGQYELIPGTDLPIAAPSRQPEGRTPVTIQPERGPVSLFDRLAQRDDIDPAELDFMFAALKHYSDRPRKLEEIFDTTGRVTDATTGNCAIPLFQVPSGTLGELTNVTVDVPGSLSITPSAPFSNAASWSYVAVGNFGTTGLANNQAAPATTGSLRQGLVAFAPTSAAGPILPGQWTFSDKNCPVGLANETMYYCLVGGSIAALLNLTLQVTYRVRLFGFERGVS